MASSQASTATCIHTSRRPTSSAQVRSFAFGRFVEQTWVALRQTAAAASFTCPQCSPLAERVRIARASIVHSVEARKPVSKDVSCECHSLRSLDAHTGLRADVAGNILQPQLFCFLMMIANNNETHRMGNARQSDEPLPLVVLHERRRRADECSREMARLA